MDKLKILVIDDKRIIGNFFEVILGHAGHHIQWMDNAPDALDAVKKEAFDIAFLDIVMPENDGITILEEIKTLSPKLPVVMMSGYSVEDKRDQSRELGAAACLKKPFEMEDVRRVVREVLGREI